MEPVLQRFGDVTIQRLEKPKEPGPQPPPQPPPSANPTPKPDKENDTSSEDEASEFPAISRQAKRNVDVKDDIAAKKYKYDLGNPPPVEDEDTDYDMSEFDSENSDLDSDGELMNFESLLSGNKAAVNKTVMDSPIIDDAASNATNASFLDKLADSPFIEASSSSSNAGGSKSDPQPPQDEDYEFDIKEKLKEMGEISFETVKKGEKPPKKVEVATENEVVVTPAKKTGNTDEEQQERKGPHMRRNIREVMDDTKLDESTLAAQRMEAERLRRVQEQQRLLRELQRQAAQERMQHKVISLLQGGSTPKPGTSSATRIGNTVLVKLPNGQTKPVTKLPKRPSFEDEFPVNVPKGVYPPVPPPKSMQMMQQQQQQQQLRKPGANLTPSVSIAPVAKRPPSMSSFQQTHSDSDSEMEDFKPQDSGFKMDHKGTSMDKEPVQTIDISSDDDCIVVSETEADAADETEEDPSNSGMHTNDEFNQPDEQGRVVVNVGHPDDESDIFVAPQIARIMKPHQIGGVRFLYDNVVESINRFESSSGFGCILAHSMGLGKTLQIVCFSDIFLRHTSAKTILCIMPINTLQNWMAEFNMWLPTEENAANSSLQAHGEVRPRNFNLHVLNDSHKTLTARSKVIHAWKTDGGVLLIGYEQFRLLSLKKHPKSRRKNPTLMQQDDDRNKKMFDEIHEALINPGPDLVICDEGHRIKNSHASISQALKQMKTKRRVVLTGYPLQNNLMEYWCMVDFVRPNYLGSKTEFCNMFERPIMNGQCIDSTEADIKLMRYRAHVLHSLLVGFVQRRSHTVLQTALPKKEEYVLLVRMTPFQRMLYETFMNEVVRIQAVPNPLKAFAVCCKIWNHPDVLYNFIKKRAGGEAVDVDIDLEEVNNKIVEGADSKEAALKKKPKPKRNNTKNKKGDKPAASVTPYTSTQQEISTQTSTINLTAATSTLTNSKPNITASEMDTATTALSTPSTSTSVSNQDSFQNQYSNYYDSGGAVQNFDQNAQFPNNFQQPQQQNNQSFKNNESTYNYMQNAPPNPSPNNNFNQNAENIDYYSTQQNYYNHNQAPYQQNQDFSNNYVQDQAYQNPYQNNQFTNSFHSWNQTAGNQENYNNYYPTPVPPQQQQQQQQQSMQPSTNNSFNNFDSNYMNSNANHSWIKQEDQAKSVEVNGPIKSEASNDSKKKINIISDIKLPPVSSDKKINIISDIKIEPKKEEDAEVKIENKDGIVKNEVKNEEEEQAIKKEENENDEDENGLPKIKDLSSLKDIRDDTGIPYDWAVELLKDYVPGCIENSAKMQILFCIIKESIALGDRLLVFSQSLITLDLIEQFLQMNLVPGETSLKWAKNTSYYRLDGSTSALEREKLINEFNSNPKIHLFLVSTRAGSLGINLVGANRVVVLDASWNPCHDTQAVCRVYRYGQRKPCFVYRLVVDNCMEKKIYDRQINKQGMSDRVVDECNPDAHLTLKDVSTLCWDNVQDEGEEKDWSHVKDNYIDVVLQKVLDCHGRTLNKEPFQHESLLVDRKEKQLSRQEKRLAKKGYEREKNATRQPTYANLGGLRGHRPVASVRPMQQGNDRPSRWIPAEHWQRQGMTAQEMTLPLDVVIPTNQPEKGNIVLKAGQKVLVLKSPKGVYMQLESGKIVAIKTAIKVKGKADDNDPTKMMKAATPPTMKVNPPPSMPVMPQQRHKIRPMMTPKFNVRSVRQSVPNLVNRIQGMTPKKNVMTKQRPYQQKNDEAMPGSSSEDEHHHERGEDINKKLSLLKKHQISVQRVPNQKKMGNPSTLEQLEQSTSSALSNNSFQDSLDNITNHHYEADDGASIASDQKSSQEHEISDHSDEVTYVSEQPPPMPVQHQPPPQQYLSQPQQQQQQQQQLQQQQTQQPVEVKPENSDYYNNYYNYPAYHPQPPIPPPVAQQTYQYPPAPAPPPPQYDYQQQPPPQQHYNYNYPPPPPPNQPYYAPPPPPQQTYDYNAAPPPPAAAPAPPPPQQQMYSYNPYPPPPQQYQQPPTGPPPPQQAMYPNTAPPYNFQPPAPPPPYYNS